MEFCQSCGIKMAKQSLRCTSCGFQIQSQNSTFSPQKANASSSQSYRQPSYSQFSSSNQHIYTTQSHYATQYSEDFTGTINEALKVFYFEPKRALPLFASENPPNVFGVVFVSLALTMFFGIVHKWRLAGSLNLLDIIFASLFPAIGFLVGWSLLSILLYALLHTGFSYGTHARASVRVWFKFAAYLMVFNSFLTLVKICLVFIARRRLILLENPFTDEVNLVYAYPVWFIYADFFTNLLGAFFVSFFAYRVLKNGFNFSNSKAIFSFLAITLPVAFGHLIAYYIVVAPLV